MRACVAGCAIVFCAALSATALWAEGVAPTLPVVGLDGASVSLEDFKGQTTAVVFFNDSAA